MGYARCMADIATHELSRTKGVRVRSARRRDFDAIRRNHQITFAEHKAREETFKVGGPFIDDYLSDLTSPLAWLGGLMGRDQSVVLVAEVDGRVEGHIAYTRYSNQVGPYAAIVGDVSIAPEHRRSGLGRALVGAMEHREALAGTTSFAASIWPENRASAQLFSTLGYAPFAGNSPNADTRTLVEKAIPFGTLPLTVTMAKSAVLTLFAIAVGYQLFSVFIG